MALALAEKGCNVAVHYNASVDEALETRDMARGFGVKGEAIQADLSAADQCARLWSETVEKLGEVPSIVINNASFFNRVGIEDVTPNDFDHAMAVNVRAPLLLAQAMARDLPDDAIGKIVNINDRRTAYRSRSRLLDHQLGPNRSYQDTSPESRAAHSSQRAAARRDTADDR